MKEKLAKLIDVKSIVTLALTGVFAFLALKGAISGSDFLTVFLIIIGFYFGTQSQKRADGAEAPQEESVSAIGFDTGEGSE